MENSKYQLEKNNFFKIVYPRKTIFRRLIFREITTKTKTVYILIVKIIRNQNKYIINYSSSQKGMISYILQNK
jgi:hypothetical protein